MVTPSSHEQQHLASTFDKKISKFIFARNPFISIDIHANPNCALERVSLTVVDTHIFESITFLAPQIVTFVQMAFTCILNHVPFSVQHTSRVKELAVLQHCKVSILFDQSFLSVSKYYIAFKSLSEGVAKLKNWALPFDTFSEWKDMFSVPKVVSGKSQFRKHHQIYAVFIAVLRQGNFDSVQIFLSLSENGFNLADQHFQMFLRLFLHYQFQCLKIIFTLNRYQNYNNNVIKQIAQYSVPQLQNLSICSQTQQAVERIVAAHKDHQYPIFHPKVKELISTIAYGPFLIAGFGMVGIQAFGRYDMLSYLHAFVFSSYNLGLGFLYNIDAILFVMKQTLSLKDPPPQYANRLLVCAIPHAICLVFMNIQYSNINLLGLYFSLYIFNILYNKSPSPQYNKGKVYFVYSTVSFGIMYYLFMSRFSDDQIYSKQQVNNKLVKQESDTTKLSDIQ